MLRKDTTPEQRHRSPVEYVRSNYQDLAEARLRGVPWQVIGDELAAAGVRCARRGAPSGGDAWSRPRIIW